MTRLQLVSVILNTFCFQTTMEITASAEMVYENVEPVTVAHCIAELGRNGLITRRRRVAPNKPLEYILREAI